MTFELLICSKLNYAFGTDLDDMIKFHLDFWMFDDSHPNGIDMGMR